MGSAPRFSQLKYGSKPGLAEGWVCQADNFPALKWFSPTDQSQGLPFPITCNRVDRHVAGGSWSDWAGWFKLLKLVDVWPL